MRVFSRHKGWISGLLVAAMALVTLAPAADAGHRRKGRYKGDRGGYCETREYRQVYAPRRARYDRSHSRYSSYRVRRSDAGPVIAGFIGGLFLGATLANAAPAGYEYYDPYCGAKYSTLRSYHEHLGGGCGHPSVVQVREHRVERYSEYRRDEYRRDDGYHESDYRRDRDDDRDYDRDWDDR